MSSKMKKLSKCRICSVENVGMLIVDNKQLQEVYEKLTDIPFVTEDSRPIHTCFGCLNELKQSYQLLNKCLKADERFAQMMLKDYETKSSINQDRNELYSELIKNPTEQKSILEVCPTESITIKEELPDVCEELDDIVETKEEYQTNEIKAENIDDICPLDTDILANNSKSYSENDVHFKEAKIEVEEEDVSKKIQKAEEMIKIKAENIDDSCPLDTDIVAHHSKSYSENDVHFKEVKIEVEEEDVSKKIQKAEEMIRATVAKNPKLEPGTPEQDNGIKTEHPEKQKSDPKVIRPSQKLMQEPETQFKEAYKCNQPAKSIIKRTRSPIVKKQYKCDVCHSSFKQKINLSDHIRIHTGEKPYKCKVCQLSFSRNIFLKYHSRKHTGEKPYKCDVCERSFARSDTLKKHTRIHTGEKPFQCVLCQRSFNQNGQLKDHSKVHTGEKPYKCDVCHSSFKQKINLSDHIRIHTGEKPYKCKVCQLSFRRNIFLKNHSRIHTGEKPYKCDVCERSFTRSDTLKSHTRIHTGEKPFQCVLCQRSFNQKMHLKDHIRVHTGEKPYKCDICEKSYTHKNNLKKHVCLHLVK